MNRKEMQEMLDEFVSSLQNEYEEDWYATDREIGKEMVERFMRWKFADEMAQEERYKQYLELKREFESKEYNPLLDEVKSLYEIGI